MLKKRDIVRRNMLELLPKKGKGAEIGVWEGRFSVDILEITDPETLFLIDPWEYMPEHSNAGFGRKRNAERMPQMFDIVSEKFKDDKRVSIHQGTSEDVLSQMDDDSLDWVYIDGNHNEPFISNDLKLALQKVKPGGVIAGDDYYWNKDEGAPIKMAVNAFVAKLGDKCSFQLMGQQYVISLAP
jgi:hypothetical protein